MRMLKNISFSVVATILFFTLLEGISRLFLFPGSYDFIERRAIEQGLHQRKGRGEFRILLYGESTMHGGHLYPYSTIDKWVKAYFKDLLPEKISRCVTVTNFGRLGASSRFITTAFVDTVPYKPDLAVFYMAHNDFIQLKNRREYFSRKPAMERFEDLLEELPKHSSFVNAMNGLIIRAKIMRNRAGDKSLKKIDHWYDEEDREPSIAASDLLDSDSPEFTVIRKDFETDVNKAVSVARENSIPIIFLEGVARWKGYEPVRSAHAAFTEKNGLTLWTGIFFDAEDLFVRERYGEALLLYKRCLELDAHYALTYYRMGQCYEHLNEFGKANEFYSLANDNDRFPIRAPSAVNRFYESLRALAMRGVYIVQTQKLFEDRSPNGIVDETLITDQIHPTIEGQALIAREIVKVIYDKGLLAPKGQWRWDRLRTVEETKKALGFDKNDEFEICLALAGYVKNHYTKAAEFLEKALTIRPDSVFAKSWLARTYWKKGEKKKALDLYRQLYRKVPSSVSEYARRHLAINIKLLDSPSR